MEKRETVVTGGQMSTDGTVFRIDIYLFGWGYMQFFIPLSDVYVQSMVFVFS